MIRAIRTFLMKITHLYIVIKSAYGAEFSLGTYGAVFLFLAAIQEEMYI
jgi:hypothetical protein